jgi:hypothetical protein
MKWQDVFPVAISVVVIILVAVIEKQSKLIAAVTATMPLGIPLALWIVYSSTRGEKKAVEEFTQSMVVGIIPTVAFAVAAWLGARAGWKLLPLLGAGYATWVITLILMIGVRRVLGI